MGTRAYVLLALGLISSACDAGGGARTTLVVGDECALNTECESPLVCRLGRCRNACESSRDCPPGISCVRGTSNDMSLGQLGACLVPSETTCSVNSDCPVGLRCRERKCEAQCVETRDCTSGATCVLDPDTGARTCVEPTSSSCVYNSDCAAPMICDADQRCRLECNHMLAGADRDCPNDRRCESVGPNVDRCVLRGGVLPDGGAPGDGALADPRCTEATDLLRGDGSGFVDWAPVLGTMAPMLETNPAMLPSTISGRQVAMECMAPPCSVPVMVVSNRPWFACYPGYALDFEFIIGEGVPAPLTTQSHVVVGIQRPTAGGPLAYNPSGTIDALFVNDLRPFAIEIDTESDFMPPFDDQLHFRVDGNRGMSGQIFHGGFLSMRYVPGRTYRVRATHCPAPGIGRGARFTLQIEDTTTRMIVADVTGTDVPLGSIGAAGPVPELAASVEVHARAGISRVDNVHVIGGGCP